MNNILVRIYISRKYFRSFRSGGTPANANINELFNSRDDCTKNMDMILKEEYVRAWQKQSQVISFSEAIQGDGKSDHWRRDSVEDMVKEGDTSRKCEAETKQYTDSKSVSKKGSKDNSQNSDEKIDKILPSISMGISSKISGRRDTAFRIKPILGKRSPFLKPKKNIYYE